MELNDTQIYLRCIGELTCEERRDLPPEELSYAKNLTPLKRQNEYLAARWLVYKNLNLNKPLLKDISQRIIWPKDITASISHSQKSAGFTFSHQKDSWGIGLDIESIARCKIKLAPKILNKSESQLLRDISHGADDFQKNLAIAFTAKEALFKAHFPVGKINFYFHDARITHIDERNKQLTLELLKQTSVYSPKSYTSQAFWSEKIAGEILTLIKEPSRRIQ